LEQTFSGVFNAMFQLYSTSIR